MSQIVAACPTCGSDHVVPILFGFPGDDMIADSEAGKIELGGCVLTDNDPAWSCRACGSRWGSVVATGLDSP